MTPNCGTLKASRWPPRMELPLPSNFRPDQSNCRLVQSHPEDIDACMTRGALPHVPDAWVDESRPGGELLMYRTSRDATPIRVLLEGESVWLTQRLIAKLYGTSVGNINQHFSAVENKVN